MRRSHPGGSSPWRFCRSWPGPGSCCGRRGRQLSAGGSGGWRTTLRCRKLLLGQGQLDALSTTGKACALGDVVDTQLDAVAVLEVAAAETVAERGLAIHRTIGAVEIMQMLEVVDPSVADDLGGSDRRDVAALDAEMIVAALVAQHAVAPGKADPDIRGLGRDGHMSGDRTGSSRVPRGKRRDGDEGDAGGESGHPHVEVPSIRKGSRQQDAAGGNKFLSFENR